MKRVPTHVVKERSRRLTAAFESYSTWDHLVGTVQQIWVTEVATDGHNLVGHTSNYAQVLVDPSQASLGSTVRAQLIEASKWSLRADNVERLQVPVTPSVFAKAKVTKHVRRNAPESQSEAEPAPDPEPQPQTQSKPQPPPWLSKFTLALSLVTLVLMIFWQVT